jgi:hypothetical protein
VARKLPFDFLRTEVASASVLAAAAVAALLAANSPWSADYFGLLKSLQTLQLGPFSLELTRRRRGRASPQGRCSKPRSRHAVGVTPNSALNQRVKELGWR